MKYLIPLILLALSQCGPSTECANVPLAGLWYDFQSTGHNFWFRDTCEVTINNCQGYTFQDLGTSVKFIESDHFHMGCNYPITNKPEEPYQIIGNELSINGQVYRKY